MRKFDDQERVQQGLQAETASAATERGLTLLEAYSLWLQKSPAAATVESVNSKLLAQTPPSFPLQS